MNGPQVVMLLWKNFLVPSPVARHFGNVQLYYMEACVGTSGSLLSVGGRGISS